MGNPLSRYTANALFLFFDEHLRQEHGQRGRDIGEELRYVRHGLVRMVTSVAIQFSAVNVCPVSISNNITPMTMSIYAFLSGQGIAWLLRRNL